MSPAVRSAIDSATGGKGNVVGWAFVVVGLAFLVWDRYDAGVARVQMSWLDIARDVGLALFGARIITDRTAGAVDTLRDVAGHLWPGDARGERRAEPSPPLVGGDRAEDPGPREVVEAVRKPRVRKPARPRALPTSPVDPDPNDDLPGVG